MMRPITHPRTHRALWIASAVILTGIGVILLGLRHAPSRPPEDAAVRVVAGPSVQENDRPSVPATPSAAPSGTMAGLPDFDTLSEPERRAVLGRRPRREPWASTTEAMLRRRLAGAAEGLTISTVSCADRICAVEGRLAASAIHDQQTAIALLKNGPLDRGYGDVGLTKSGTVTINADAAGNLSFTQYIARAS